MTRSAEHGIGGGAVKAAGAHLGAQLPGRRSTVEGRTVGPSLGHGVVDVGGSKQPVGRLSEGAVSPRG